jgi:hypothetical protein
MRAIEQLLAKLERDNPAGTLLYAFADAGETADQVIARQFPEELPVGVTLVIYRWADGQ